MLKRYKNDISTITELLVVILSYFTFSFLGFKEYIIIPYWTLVAGFWIYRQFIYYKWRRGTDSNVLSIPTENDSSNQTIILAIGILIIFWSGVYLFAFDGNKSYSIIGAVIGAICFFYGLIDVPKGYIEVIGTKMKIYGMDVETDVRQLKNIVLKDNVIILTNIYNENHSAFRLKLDTTTAEKITGFLIQKAFPYNAELNIVNNVA